MKLTSSFIGRESSQFLLRKILGGPQYPDLSSGEVYNGRGLSTPRFARHDDIHCFDYTWIHVPQRPGGGLTGEVCARRVERTLACFEHQPNGRFPRHAHAHGTASGAIQD